MACSRSIGSLVLLVGLLAPGCRFDHRGLPAGGSADGASPDLTLTPDRGRRDGAPPADVGGPDRTVDTLCIPTGTKEHCDGKDNDCNGKIDDGAVCEDTTKRCCGGTCVDTTSDVKHCGSCGYVCAQVAQASPVCKAGGCTFSCNPGFDDCDGKVVNGCEANLATSTQHCGKCGNAVDVTQNPQHCGRCGHACLGGTCKAGRCEPLELATAGEPVAMLVHGGYLYWADMALGTIARIKLSGTGNAVEPLVKGQGEPVHLAVFLAQGAWHLCWTDAKLGRVMRSALDGTGVNVLASQQRKPMRLAGDVTGLYWTNQGTGSDGQVMFIAPGSPAPKALVGGESKPVDIAVDATRVYWTALGAGKVRAMPKAGGQPTTLADQQKAPTTLTLDAQYVYWTETVSSGAVRRVDKAGTGPVKTLYSGQTNPREVAALGGKLLWTSPSASTVHEGDIAGTKVTTLAQQTGRLVGLWVDATAVYWAEVTSESPQKASVWRLAR